jgi:uncharacterized protein YecT (DUF1311 family)
MTMRSLDQPHVIYTGALPPHLMRAEEPEAEEFLVDESGSRRPILPIVATAAIALAVGVAIGIFAVPLVRPAPPPAHPTVSLAPPAAIAPAAPVAIPTPERAPPAAPLSTPHPRVTHAKAPPRAAAPRPAGKRHACSSGLSPVERAICSDPHIAAADQEMQGVYLKALRSGAPADALRAAQIDWLAVREQAARRSTADLAQAYRTRIAELNTASEEPPH